MGDTGKTEKRVHGVREVIEFQRYVLFDVICVYSVVGLFMGFILKSNDPSIRPRYRVFVEISGQRPSSLPPSPCLNEFTPVLFSRLNLPRSNRSTRRVHDLGSLGRP